MRDRGAVVEQVEPAGGIGAAGGDDVGDVDGVAWREAGDGAAEAGQHAGQGPLGGRIELDGAGIDDRGAEAGQRALAGGELDGRGDAGTDRIAAVDGADEYRAGV